MNPKISDRLVIQPTGPRFWDKLLAKLNNIYMTHVNDGWVFDEIVEEKKELFRILNLPVPTSEQFVEQNDAPEAPDDLIDIEEIAAETAFDDAEDL